MRWLISSLFFLLMPPLMMAQSWTEITQEDQPYQTLAYYTTSSAHYFFPETQEMLIWGAIVSILHQADGDQVSTISQQQWRLNCQARTIRAENHYDFTADGVPIAQRYRYLHAKSFRDGHTMYDNLQAIKDQSQYGANRYFAKTEAMPGSTEEKLVNYLCRPSAIAIRRPETGRRVDHLVEILKQKYPRASTL